MIKKVLKVVFNVIVIGLVLAITYLTFIVLQAYLSHNIGISISYDMSSVLIPLFFLISSLIYNVINKSWIMITVSTIGLIEMVILVLIIFKIM